MHLKILPTIFMTLSCLILFIDQGKAQSDDSLFISKQFTAKGLFTDGIEGPAVDKFGNIYAVNYGERGTIGKVTPDGECSLFVTLPSGSVGNGIRFNKKGEMFVADYKQHNILKIDMTMKNIEVYAHEDGMNQPNDLAIADNGVLYASDPNWSENTGNIWRIDTNRTVHLLEAGMGTTNGIEISPDNRKLYVNESNQHRIWVYDLSDSGTISNKRILAAFNDEVFDGMRCDSVGNLYVSCYNKGMVYIISPGGSFLKKVELIGNTVSNICFGGADGRSCYVTMVDNKNIETFRTDIPGRSWVMQQEATGIWKRRSSIRPQNFKLGQNYPNPFNPVTSICFDIPKSGLTKLTVFDMLGKEVATLVNKELSAGNYKYQFNGSGLSSGLYTYRIDSNGYSEIKKMILLK